MEYRGVGYYYALGGGDDWYNAGGPFKVTASSYLPSTATTTYGPENAHDLHFNTAWVEGVEGYGIGEHVKYYFNPEAPRITQVIVANGYVKSEKTYRENSRVKKLKMYIDNKPFAILNLEDCLREQIFEFEPIGRTGNSIWTLKFEILEVYKGDTYDDTAITGIYFSGLDVLCFGQGTKIHMDDNTLKNIELVKKGDIVKSYDFVNKKMTSSHVASLITAIHSNLFKLKLSDNVIITTSDHPFWIEGNIWAAINPEKANNNYYQQSKVEKLKIGDKVFLPEKNIYSTIIDMETVEGQQTTCTIELSENDNFIANGMLVKTESFTGTIHRQLPDTIPVGTTIVCTDNQQIVKGLGGGLPWPSARSGFPITDHPEGMKILLDMGISMARIYWHNQSLIFDANGDPTPKGQTMIDGFLQEIRWLNENNIPYNMDGGINNMPRECYNNNPENGHLLRAYEPAQIKGIITILKAIREAGLKMPIVVTPFNEPSAPITVSNNGPSTGAMSREQCVRMHKLLRTEMDNAGFGDILLGYSENGQPMYANFYAGNDIGSSPDAYGGTFIDVACGEKKWPFFNPASSRYDDELDAIVGAFTTHSYYPSIEAINDYIEGYGLARKGRDNWMTEYCISTQVTANHNQTLLRKFISDMVFFRFNYWEFWNIWNISSRAPATDILCGGNDGLNRKPASYYALAKIFTSITPGETYVRRLTSDVPGLTVTNDIAMDGAAFVSPSKTVVVLINSTPVETSTSLKGLYGQKAQVFQIEGTNDELFDTDMLLVANPDIIDGMIGFIAIPYHTITIIVTDGGY